MIKIEWAELVVTRGTMPSRVVDAEWRGDVLEWQGLVIPLTNVVCMKPVAPSAKCVECGQEYRTPQALSQHIRHSHHKGDFGSKSG